MLLLQVFRRLSESQYITQGSSLGIHNTGPQVILDNWSLELSMEFTICISKSSPHFGISFNDIHNNNFQGFP